MITYTIGPLGAGLNGEVAWLDDDAQDFFDAGQAFPHLEPAVVTQGGHAGGAGGASDGVC